MVCSQNANSAWSDGAGWSCRSPEGGQWVTEHCPRPLAPFREDLVLSEWVMKRQQWMVRRRMVGHAAAQRRWDKAYQLLLQTGAAPPGTPARPAALWDAAEESRHARDRKSVV